MTTPVQAPDTLIYKIYRPQEWQQVCAGGRFDGSADDLRDGFIHFSFLDQLGGTLARFFADSERVIIAEYPVAQLPVDAYRIENGFPHLYAPLDGTLCRRDWTLTRLPGADFVLPDMRD